MANYSKTNSIKNKIMNSAKTLFSKYGYENVKVIDIANDAGVAKGLIFYHFKSKDELLNQIIYDEFSSLFRNSIAININLSPDIALEQLFTAMFMPQNNIKVCDGYFEDDIPEKYHLAIDKARQDIVYPIIYNLIKNGVEQKLFDIDEPQISAEIMSLGFDRFLHINSVKFTDSNYYSQFLRSAQYLLNSTLKPKRMNFSFDYKRVQIKEN